MSLKPYTEFKNAYVGETAFVCGAGPSFLQCIEHPDFSKIHNHVVVSVNSSIIAMPWQQGEATKRFWISNDALVRIWSYWSYVKSCKANKIVRDSWKRYFEEIPDFYQFWIRPTSEDIINPEDEGLAYCSSVPSAIDLCLQMGCKTIYLLGVDQYKIGNKTHFWQFWDRKKQPKRIDGKIASFEEQTKAFVYNNLTYPALKKFAEHVNARIYNCNIDSTVNDFNKITFIKALSML